MHMKSFMLAAIGVAFMAPSQTMAQDSDIEIVNIRIGQGDATLIRGPANAQGKRIAVLFDAGDDARSTDADYEGGKIIAAVLKRRGVSHIDYVVISHYDEDHIGGLIFDPGRKNASLLFGPNGVPGVKGDDDGNGISDWDDIDPQAALPAEYGRGDDITVGTFVDRGDEGNKNTTPYQLYVKLASSNGNRMSLNSQAILDAFVINLGNGALMTPYASSGRIRGSQGKVPLVDSENEQSVSMLLTYKNFDFLVSGDMIGRKHSAENARVERAVGDKIAAQGRIVDVLHVNHHGANNGSDAEFLEQIKPTIAVISHGNVGSYKHPNVETLKRLEAAKVYRIIQTKWGTTDVALSNKAVKDIQAIYQGDVVITSDGDEYTVSTSRTFRSDSNPRRPGN
jgi:beta-lactamase superfamily II metal-dependent hydrolase